MIRLTVNQLFEMSARIEETGLVRADGYFGDQSHPSKPIAWARDKYQREYYLCLWTDTVQVEEQDIAQAELDSVIGEETIAKLNADEDQEIDDYIDSL